MPAGFKTWNGMAGSCRRALPGLLKNWLVLIAGVSRRWGLEVYTRTLAGFRRPWGLEVYTRTLAGFSRPVFAPPFMGGVTRLSKSIARFSGASRSASASHSAAILTTTITALILGGCAKEPAVGKHGEPVEIRVGYYPNVTHAQALIGMRRGDFQKSVGPHVKIVPHTFNAGPAAIQAIYAGHLDISYIGPSPALNGFIQSKGEEVRVIAGSATNGVTVVGSKIRGITSLKQLKGKRIATPNFANTQDISARYFLTHLLGAKLKNKGGETDIIPIANPDIETLFAKNQLDAAWVPEPWGARLIYKDLAVEVVQEKDLWPEKSFAITTVIARRAFVEKYPDLVARFLEAHVKLTREIQADPQSFVVEINEELKRITTKSLPPEVISDALSRTGFSVDPSASSFERYFMMGKEVGIIKAETFNVKKLLLMGPLEQALAAVGKKTDVTTTDSMNSRTTISRELGTQEAGL